MKKAAILILSLSLTVVIQGAGVAVCGDVVSSTNAHTGPIEIPLHEYQGVLLTVPAQAGGEEAAFHL